MFFISQNCEPYFLIQAFIQLRLGEWQEGWKTKLMSTVDTAVYIILT